MGRELRHDLSNGLTVIDLEPAASRNLQPPRIEPEQMEHGGVNVGDVVTILDRMEAELVGGAVDHAAFDAAARQPGAEALRMMVAAVALSARRAAELRAPDDQS